MAKSLKQYCLLGLWCGSSIDIVATISMGSGHDVNLVGSGPKSPEFNSCTHLHNPPCCATISSKNIEDSGICQGRWLSGFAGDVVAVVGVYAVGANC